MLDFFDIPEKALPKDAQYYFNVLVITIGVNPDEAEEYFPKGVESIWYLDELTNPRPRVIHIYIDQEFDEVEIDEELEEFDLDIECEDLNIEILPHQVVEIHPTLGISIYDMIDFDTDDAWQIL